MKILYLTKESFPSFRNDIRVLFGKYLPQYDINASILARQSTSSALNGWQAGPPILYKGSRRFHRIYNFLEEVFLVSKHAKDFDVLQVRDKPGIGLISLLIARQLRKPFYFWMSWPHPEDDLERIKADRVFLNIVKRIYLFMRAILLGFLQYKIVFAFADHIFVQSEPMKSWLVEKGVPGDRMTPVPMGVDLSEVNNIFVYDDRFENKSRIKTIAQLGEITSARKVPILLTAFKKISEQYSPIRLLLIGTTPTGEDLRLLKERINEMGLAQKVILTGWLSQNTAWKYLRKADIGINFIPRNILFDTSTPTKILEYAAIGLPCIVSDNPDQLEMIKKLKCGICIPFDTDLLIQTVLRLLNEPELLKRYSENGRRNIARYRSYQKIAKDLGCTYNHLYATYRGYDKS